ncbi:MAG: 16S rRNA (guanine(966)-N(2))-methyltransferase RsmD [Planctomycetes bacterium]|nr:16S rRNA (guanine(966)-N(2))-methyltransferase RsmD [Planctomycetota bacterium]
MRIIAGTHRSRLIKPPRDQETTRPITDRVKQALFDRLTMMAVFDGAAVDLFAGTGSLGLEALSRGSEHCTFIERDRDTRKVLDDNIKTLGFADRAVVMSSDVLLGVWVAQLPHKPANLIFLDPPYAMMADEAEVKKIEALIARLAEHTHPEGVLVLRTKDGVTPPTVEGWEGPATYNYGSMSVHLYQRPAAR